MPDAAIIEFQKSSCRIAFVRHPAARCEGATMKTMTMKTIASFIVVACLMSGCVAGSAISHEDSPAAAKRDAGPMLCRDGSTPPCNDRD
jgi:hypothetical protein